MNVSESHGVWRLQVQKLKDGLTTLTNTDPQNLLQHFFLQAVQNEFARELESYKTTIKTIICSAVRQTNTLTGTPRERAAAILKQLGMVSEPLLPSIRLADIRNRAVFEVYKQCGITVDTYFERYPNPPGSDEQNHAYSLIAHGSAQATATQTVRLSNILVWMQLLKRLFVVHDHITADAPLNEYNLNWIGAMWSYRIQEKTLGDLIWELYLDVWQTEQ